MVLTETLLVIVGILTAIYWWFQYNHNYWKRKGIPYVRPVPIIGNIKEILTKKNGFGLHISDIYRDPAMQEEAVVGMYALHKPILIIRDKELIKSVLIKDFYKFSNRYGRCDPHGDPLAANNIFFTRNPLWKELRAKLTPVFTSGKVKQMYPLMLEIAGELEAFLERKTKHTGNFQNEVKEISSLFTTDLIATIAFGVHANSLQNANAEFIVQARKLFDFSTLRSLGFFIVFLLPKLVGVLRIKTFTEEFASFMRRTINYVIDERERSGKTRNDLIDILVGLKKEAALEKNEKHYAKNNDFLVAQAGVFFTAGFETSSSTMAFALYELAKEPDMQQRLREEINEALLAENGKLSYEKLQSLEYLSMVVDEVLRKYPILPFLDREYMSIKGEKPFSLKPHYDYELEDGLPIYIPVFGIQRDEKYWPEPDKFDPERFSPENKKKIDPMVYMPFGVGPHNCIGNRVGLLQTKIGLVHFFKNYCVEPCAKTVSEISFDPGLLTLQADTGIHLKIINDGLYDNRAVQK